MMITEEINEGTETQVLLCSSIDLLEAHTTLEFSTAELEELMAYSKADVEFKESIKPLKPASRTTLIGHW